MHWIGARTLAEALDRIHVAGMNAPKGTWLIVAGGWTERQFAEGRRPTQAEIAAAAPDHHVYVQILYSAILLTPGGAEALGIAQDPALLRGSPSRPDADGKPTGWISGDNRTISDVFNLLPRPSFAQQVAGTRAFFRALNGARHHRRARSRRLQHADPRVPAAVPGLARPRAHRAGRLQPVRAAPRPRARRPRRR